MRLKALLFLSCYTFAQAYALPPVKPVIVQPRGELWSRFLNRPMAAPPEMKEKSVLQNGCPTGFPQCRLGENTKAKLIFPKGRLVYTNDAKDQVIKAIETEEELLGKLKPGDIIVFASQQVMHEGGLSEALNGNHHTALVGTAPNGKLAWTASPKPENPRSFLSHGDGFHILRLDPKAHGLTAAEHKQVMEYVEKYFDILYRSNEKSGVFFDYQGTMDIDNKKLLSDFAQNLKNARKSAKMSDIFPGGEFRVFCSESAVTAYALAFNLIGKTYRPPRQEGLHQSINMVYRDFARASAKHPKKDPVDIMEKVMGAFFSGEALRVEKNSDDPTKSTDYTPAERRAMAQQLYTLLRFGPGLAHGLIWGLHQTGLDAHPIMGENLNRATQLVSPYDLAMNPLNPRGDLKYVGTFIGPDAKLVGNILRPASDSVGSGLEAAIANPAAAPGRHRASRTGMRHIVGCAFADITPNPPRPRPDVR